MSSHSRQSDPSSTFRSSSSPGHGQPTRFKCYYCCCVFLLLSAAVFVVVIRVYLLYDMNRHSHTDVAFIVERRFKRKTSRPAKHTESGRLCSGSPEACANHRARQSRCDLHSLRNETQRYGCLEPKCEDLFYGDTTEQ